MYLREKCRFLLNVKIHAKNFFGGVHQKHGASRQCVSGGVKAHIDGGGR